MFTLRLRAIAQILTPLKICAKVKKKIKKKITAKT